MHVYRQLMITFLTFLKKYHLLILIALTAIFGACVIVYSTKNNPWGFTDSIAYLVSARNLANGTGLGYHHPNGSFRFLTHYPPFYPLVLSAMDVLGMQVIDAARLLDILLFPATLVLVALIFYRFSRMPHLGLAVAVLLFSFEPMLLMAASAMSEPLFVFLPLASGLCLLLHLEHGGNRWLVMSALLTSASALTRYIGAAWIVTGIISLLLFSQEDWRTRLRPAARFLLISAVPVLLWFVWVYAFADKTVGGRTINFNLADLFDQLEPFRGLVVTTIWRWLPFQSVIGRVRYIWRVVALLALVVVSITASLRANRGGRGTESHISDFHVFSIFGIFSAAHLILLMLIYSFSSPTPDIDNRILLPLFVSLAISFYAGASLWIETFGRKRRLAWMPWLLVLASVWGYLPESYRSVLQRPEYAGLTSRYWQESPIIAEARRLPSDAVIISNQPEVILMWADRPAYRFGGFSPDFVESDSFYGSDLNDPAQKLFREGNAFLVVTNDFYPTSLQSEGLTAERQVLLFKGLDVYKRFEDGTIHVFP
jgi:hypothetical protein